MTPFSGVQRARRKESRRLLQLVPDSAQPLPLLRPIDLRAHAVKSDSLQVVVHLDADGLVHQAKKLHAVLSCLEMARRAEGPGVALRHRVASPTARNGIPAADDVRALEFP